jgi:hypothetical protein
MRRVGTGATNRFNKKYGEVGRLFQGPYKGKRVNTDDQLKYLLVYVMVKNSFEKYSGGIKEAMKNFDKAYEWAAKNPNCSLGDYAGIRKSPIIEKDLAGEFFKGPADFNKFARECMENLDLDEKVDNLKLD